MKQMIFVKTGSLEWAEVPDAQLQSPDEAIIRPKVMGRCDLDTLYLSGRLPMASGQPIGHELIGEIIELGEHAAQFFSEGQTVIVPAQISCGICRNCIVGETGRCQSVPFGASYGMGRDGGFGGAVCDRVRVPFAKAMLVPLPYEADLSKMVGLTDMATDAWRAVGPQLEKRPGATVLVMGGGTPVIGIYSAGLAIALGASRTVYIDKSPERLKVAAAYGAEVHHHIDSVNDCLFDIVVDAANNSDDFVLALAACGAAAHLTSVAPPFQFQDFPVMDMYHRGLTYTLARPNCRHGHGPVLEAWASKGFKPELVRPKLFSYEDAPDAWMDEALYVAVTTE
ncbi:MAG: alcohol dehydrogenase catalytic domain-containing protein [Hellea sp.]